MKRYNYLQEITDDVINYIDEHDITVTDENRDEISEYLNETLWNVDSVTGNASGSYTFNAYQSEEYLCHNLELLSEALTEFGCEHGEALERGPEYCDVTIRCYLLPQAIENAIDYYLGLNNFFKGEEVGERFFSIY